MSLAATLSPLALAAAPAAAAANLHGSLTITCHRARDLYNVQQFGKQDPYVLVTLDDRDPQHHSVRKSVTHDDGGTAPTWNHKLERWILTGHEYSAFVIAKDTELTLDREIARNVIPLRELVKFSGAGPVWFNLYRDGQPAGAIELSIEFVAA